MFAQELKGPNGKFNVGNFIWESYWSGFLPSIDGDDAINLYRTSPIEDFHLIVENGQEVFDCHSNHWPDFHGYEVIVLPKSQSWSVVYSHEETIHYVRPSTRANITT